MFDTTLRMDASYAQGECDNVMVGGQLFSLPVAWPVRNEYAPSMNYWMKQLLDEGLWGELQEKYMPTATCDFYDVGDSEGDTGLSALKPSFLGPSSSFIIALGTGAGMLLKYRGVVTKRRRHKKEGKCPDVAVANADKQTDPIERTRELLREKLSLLLTGLRRRRIEARNYTPQLQIRCTGACLNRCNRGSHQHERV